MGIIKPVCILSILESYVKSVNQMEGAEALRRQGIFAPNALK